MLANICTELAGVAATCNCVSVSGSEPSRLVSPDSVLRSFGFRAERYVKGPVIVEADLSQLSTHFTIEAVVMRGAVTDDCSFTGDFFVRDVDQEKFIGRLSFGGPASENSNPINALTRVANNYISDLIPNVKGSYVSETLMVTKFSESVEMHNPLFLRKNLKALSVKIMNLHGGISPGICWLEIWAECETAPYKIPSHLPSIYSGIALTKLYACSGEKSMPTVDGNDTQEVATADANPRETPNEFLDQVTLEVMNDPVTLPSGKAVNLSTIHKLFDQAGEEQIDALDPFTGLSLRNYAPVINVSLRDRIKFFESEGVGTNSSGYRQLTSKTSDQSLNDSETDHDQVRKKRLAYFENETVPSKRNKLESITHKVVLFTSRLPFEDKIPVEAPEIIDLTLDDD